MSTLEWVLSLWVLAAVITVACFVAFARGERQAAWEAQLRADAAERAALRKLGLVVRGTEAAIDEYFAAVAASEAANLDAELEAL